MATAAFPHHYAIDLAGAHGGTGELQAPPRPAILGGPPPQFGGKDEWWSPEELLLGSVGLCLMTTLQSLATRGHLEVKGFHARVEGTLDKTPGGLAFTAIRLVVDLHVAAADVARAEDMLLTAKKLCIISNSLKAPTTLEATVAAA